MAYFLADRHYEVSLNGKNILDLILRGSKVKKLMQGGLYISLLMLYPILTTNKQQKIISMTPIGKQHLVNSKVVLVKMKKEITKN